MASPQFPSVPDLKYTPPASTSPNSSSPPALPPASPNISVREYIYFLPHPLPAGTPVPYTPGLPDNNVLNLPPHAFEPTSTLVLTSPGKTFVDLRYLKAVPSRFISGSNSSSSSSDSSDSSEPGLVDQTIPDQTVPDTTLLDWGFAGHSSASPAASSPHALYGPFTHNTWSHFVDSRVPVGSPIAADEGDMFELCDGAFLEHGHAFHPHLERVAGHEERWRDVVPLSTEEGEGVVCVVLRCRDDEAGVRGVVVRVGQFVQGIVQVGDRVATERWEGGAGGWKRVGRTGEWFLPCAVTWLGERVVVGGRVRYGEFEWQVEESWVWE